MAEGVMRSLVRGARLHDKIDVESAGLEAYHVGEAPDSRAWDASRAHGVTLNSHARQFEVGDFERFDYILAMDGENREDLLELAPDAAAGAKVHLLRNFDPTAPADADVPDPYYGGQRGFDRVFDLCETACQGLLDTVRKKHTLG